MHSQNLPGGQVLQISSDVPQAKDFWEREVLRGQARRSAPAVRQTFARCMSEKICNTWHGGLHVTEMHPRSGSKAIALSIRQLHGCMVA